MKLAMPEPIHRTTCRVLYGDTDAAGVVYYANYLRYFEIGRTEYMRDLLYSYRQLEEQGLILPVVECGVRYRAPARYDDLLRIETSLAEISSIRCRFNYRILKSAETSAVPILLAHGFTVLAAITRDGRLSRLPDDIVAGLAAAGQSSP